MTEITSAFDAANLGIARVSTVILTATGSNQATAALIQSSVVILSAPSAGLGVRLPDAEVATPFLSASQARITVINPSAYAVNIYPNVANSQSGVAAGTINGASVVSLAAGAELEFFSVDGFTWEAGSTGGGGGGTTIIQAAESDSDNIVAAGTTQATATVLTSLQSRVTSGTPGGVMALAPVVNTIPPGVYNDSSGNLTVYPSTGCSFYAQSAGGGAYTQLAQNAPVLLSPGASVNLVPFSSTVSRVSVS